MKPTSATPDGAWLDTQYNNRARVPEFAAIFERWREASALARTAPGAQLDLPYGDGQRERLDLFPPSIPVDGPAPVLVFIHGGYWRSLVERRTLLRRPVLRRWRCAGGGARLRAGTGGDGRADHAADGAGPGLGLAACRRLRRRPAAHRRGRPLGRRPPGGDAAVLPLEATGRRSAGPTCSRGRCRSRASSTSSRCAIRRSCSPTCSSRRPRWRG